MSYENRIALGNLVPTIGQFKVMDKIPQYQQCEVHNLVEAPAEVPEVLRHVVFNIERGQTLHETIDFLNMCPDFKNMDIIYANELDDGAVRSGNCNVAYEIAKSIGMNYAAVVPVNRRPVFQCFRRGKRLVVVRVHIAQIVTFLWRCKK